MTCLIVRKMMMMMMMVIMMMVVVGGGGISWKWWKCAYTDICDKRHKKFKIKQLSNPWMTHGIVKLMYERDCIHAKVIQNSDTKLWLDYQKLRNQVTCVITCRKCIFWSYSCRNDHRKTWSAIKRQRLVLCKNKHSHIISGISENDLNNHFANLATKWIPNIKIWMMIFFWKRPKSSHTFRIARISDKVMKTYLITVPTIKPLI